MPRGVRLRGLKCRCGKRFYGTEEAARLANAAIQAASHDKHPVRYYQCDYKAWHWTRQLKGKGKK